MARTVLLLAVLAVAALLAVAEPPSAANDLKWCAHQRTGALKKTAECYGHFNEVALNCADENSIPPQRPDGVSGCKGVFLQQVNSNNYNEPDVMKACIVGEVDFNGQSATELDFSHHLWEHITQRFAIEECQDLTSVKLPPFLKSSSEVYFGNNPSLAGELNFPMDYRRCLDAFTIENNAALLSINLGGLSNVFDDIYIADNPLLQSIYFPPYANFYQEVIINANDALTTIALPKRVGALSSGLSVYDLDKLDSLVVPDTDVMGFTLYVADNPLLTKLIVPPNLLVVSYTEIENLPYLTEFSAPGLNIGKSFTMCNVDINAESPFIDYLREIGNTRDICFCTGPNCAGNNCYSDYCIQR